MVMVYRRTRTRISTELKSRVRPVNNECNLHLQLHLTASSGQQIERVRCEARYSGEVSEEDGPLDEQDQVDHQDEGKE